MISFNSDGIESIQDLKAEICRIPSKPNGQGLQQVMSKQDMKKLDIESPNMADSIMMSLISPKIEDQWDDELVYPDEEYA